MSGQIIPKENDLKVIFKIVEYLGGEHDFERSRIFVEVKDGSGRAFRYVSMKDRAAAHENSGNEERSLKMDNVFRRMVEGSSSDKGAPEARLNGYIEDDGDSQDEGDEKYSTLDD